ncbi:MAG: NADH-quinone oxidoreductase subunit NuoK [Acidimicrobiales bacterium]|nr:MAG: NADH-quinone oxidoreductase subunit NuoK [Acidimicrobiales bacterium]
MHAVIPYIVAALLCSTGVYGIVIRRNVVLLLMAVELILAAATLILVTADAVHGASASTGQVFALFVIVLAAVEIGIGLAIALRLYRTFGSVDITEVDAQGDESSGSDTDSGPAENTDPAASNPAQVKL